LGFLLAGSTDDYTFSTRSASSGLPATENALSAARPSGSGFTYTFSAALPADAKGSYTVVGQGYRLVTVPGSLLGQSFAVRESANNSIFYFSVDGTNVAGRRTVVDLKNCNTCHKTLALHGGTRTDTQYCVLCHNPKAATPEGMPINFRTHIHRIHTGEELENEWTVGRNYNGLRFPGDRRNCAKCHVNNSNQLPLPAGLANTDAPGLFFTPLGPASSACLGCHDGVDAAAHAFLQTAVFPGGKAAEACAACHGEGKEFSVSRVHAR
jgi:OmcA/MtrC family decaheme c-type cytochrome